jgi:LCP family protein required for cell wall assembly
MAQPHTRRSTYSSGSVGVVGGGAVSGGAVSGRAVGGAAAGRLVGTAYAPARSLHDDAALDAAFDRYERTNGIRAGGGGGQRPGGPGRPGGPAARPPQRKRRDPLWARLLVMFGALLMLLSGGAIVGGKVLLYEATSGVEKAPLLGGAGAAQGEKALKGPLNILMVGIDERPTSIDLVRADSIIILHIPEDRKGAYLFSIPRDTYVEIPPYSKTNFKGSREKINSAFAHGWANNGGREGGFELLALTVQRITGLRFNAGAIVDFSGFEKIVNALGGVDMCVDTKEPVRSEHVGFDRKGKYLHPRDGGKPMVYNPGECREFAGWEALDYVRQRKSLVDGDYGRQRHQQQFIKALAKRAKDQGVGSNPKKLIDIIKAAGKTLTVDLRGASVENWLFTVRGLADSDVVMLKANGGEFYNVPCGGESCEGLTDETIDMFRSMSDDTVGDFVLNHPEFINT